MSRQAYYEAQKEMMAKIEKMVSENMAIIEVNTRVLNAASKEFKHVESYAFSK